ncbi:glycosyltransferase family 2 protein [Lacibacter luteus]|nr:glycosyltransferase family 2 protein [Lacibacter luteus]
MFTVATVLIVPVYNPLPGWEKLLHQRYTELADALSQPLQLCIVNDGSTNGNFEPAANWLQQQLPAVIIESYTGNKGKGAALRTGVKLVEAAHYVFTDVDFPYTTASAVAIIKLMQSGNADLVIGNRNNQYYRQINSFRAGLSKLVRFFIRVLMRMPFDDTQCGLKSFNQKGKTIFLNTRIPTYLFDMEFVLQAVRSKAVVQTVAVELRKDVHLSRMPLKVLLRELKNFIGLLFS